MSERPNERARTATFEFEALRSAHNYRRAVLREFTPSLHGHVLEVGTGIGQLTALLKNLPGIESLTAIEPDPALCRKFRQALPDQPLIEGTIESLSGPHPINAILSVNVLEHIRDDEPELAAYQKLLRATNGCLCLFVPARPEIYARIDRDFGHHRRYTRPELRAKLTRAGFEIVRLDYFNIAGYFAWWLNFRLLRRRRFGDGSVRLFDRVIFPVSNFLESHILRPPFGQSLIAIARART